ncbi:hypothetical protein [Streptomyces sp. NPDC056049]|uniref:hypothetical protein n=1 Tax=Streptomyces sp. NPDC056049 TaxID=3345693 RepID=UPI0035DDB108
MSAREERLVTEDNLWELDTWLDKVGVFAKLHFDYVNSELVNTGIKFGNAPTRMTAFIGDTIVRHEDGSHTVLSAKDAAELSALRARVAELEAAAVCPSVARLRGSKCVLPVRHRGDHQDETKRHYWSDDYALGRDLPAIPHQQDRRAL